MQGVLELEVLVGELEFLKQQKHQTVEKGADVIRSAAVDDGAEQVQVVGQQQPLQQEHLVDLHRAHGGLSSADEYVMALTLHYYYF